MRPSEWYKSFLAKRNLDQPDGRHLYEYRVKEIEFNILQEVLKSNSINYDSFQLWDACFVLYAAEWWRRNYKGGHWSWDAIFDSIQKSVRPGERSQLVEGGLKKWKEKVYKDSVGKNDYLVTVIIEGGLPIETVAKESAWLKRIVNESFKEFSQLSSSEYTIEDIVHRNAESLGGFPISLKKIEIYTLLARIIKELSKLKKEYSLAKVKSAVEILDQKKHDWRLSFPIQIDSEIGKKFIDELLTDIASIPDPRAYQILMRRVLVQTQNQWQIKAIIELPSDTLDSEDLRVISQEKIDLLPSRMDVVLLGSNGERRLISTAYKTSKAGVNVIKMSGSCTIEGTSAINKWALCLSFLGEEIELPLPQGEALSPDVPWIFVLKNNQWLLEGQASHQTRAESALIVVNNNIAKIEGEHQQKGVLDSRKVIELNGDLLLHSSDGDLFRIKTKSVNDETSYVLNGTTYNANTKKTLETFLGFPSVYKLKSETLYKTIASGTMQMRLLGSSNSWQELQRNTYGLMDMRLLGKGREVLFSQRIAVLPEKFQVQSQSINLTEGKFLILGSSPFKIQVIGDVDSSIRKNDDVHEIAIKATKDMPPEFVTIALSNSISSGEIKLQFPFPAKGSKFFDKNSRQLKRGDVLYLNKLHGTRLHLFNSSSKDKYHFKFSLKDQHVVSSRDIYIKDSLTVESSHREVSLSNFEDNFRRIFSVSSNLDKGVLFEINTSQGAHSAAIEIKQYSCELNMNLPEAEFLLNGNHNELRNTEIFAFRLDISNSGQEPQALAPVLVDNSNSGKWTFNDNTKPSGVWIIYPSEKSEVVFRPKVWTLDAEQNGLDTIRNLSDVAHLREITARIEKLTVLADSMTNDFNDRNWIELDLLWKWTKHLPLSAFDIWTAFSQNHVALIALLCQQERNLIDRFIQEFPISWESISIDNWILEFKVFKKYCDERFSEFSGVIIEDKIQYVEKQLRLECIGEIIRSEVLGVNETPQYLVPCSNTLVKDIISREYKGGYGTQGLLHKETDWPEVLKDEIKSAFEALPSIIKDVLPIIELEHQKSVVYLPALLAFKALDVKYYPIDLPSDKFFKMVMIKSFDERWFYSIYNLLQAYYWMTKQKTLQL